MVFRGERVLSSHGHSEMAEAYEKAGEDPRLTHRKRQEYLEKARRARELAQDAKILEGALLRRRARKRKAARQPNRPPSLTTKAARMD
jgi:hypothetical protein